MPDAPTVSDETRTDEAEPEEFLVDELAARAQMTVRNVRAYAGRGLIEAPRLVGRTGYYNREHLQRLQLIRQLLDRGFTLAAVEKAIQSTPHSAASHTLDLMTILDQGEDDTDETMSRDDLAALAGVPRGDHSLIDSMVDLGLVEVVDDEHVKLVEPAVVRAGAAAVSMGLAPATVIGLFPILQTNLRTITDTFVRDVVTELIQPFVDAGFPEEQWERIISLVDGLLPIASQVTLGVFRSEFRQSIDAEIGEQITGLAAKRQ